MARAADALRAARFAAAFDAAGFAVRAFVAAAFGRDAFDAAAFGDGLDGLGATTFEAAIFGFEALGAAAVDGACTLNKTATAAPANSEKIDMQ